MKKAAILNEITDNLIDDDIIHERNIINVFIYDTKFIVNFRA